MGERLFWVQLGMVMLACWLQGQRRGSQMAIMRMTVGRKAGCVRYWGPGSVAGVW